MSRILSKKMSRHRGHRPHREGSREGLLHSLCSLRSPWLKSSRGGFECTSESMLGHCARHPSRRTLPSPESFDKGATALRIVDIPPYRRAGVNYSPTEG